jgi:uncharacterized protein
VPGAETDSPILRACRAGDAARLAELLDGHPLLDIFEAAAVGQAGRVSELLDRDAGLVRALSDEGLTPLHYAARHGHPGVVRRLLRRGADVAAISRADGRTQPLQEAETGGHAEVVTQLRRAGAGAGRASHC